MGASGPEGEKVVNLGAMRRKREREEEPDGSEKEFVWDQEIAPEEGLKTAYSIIEEFSDKQKLMEAFGERKLLRPDQILFPVKSGGEGETEADMEQMLEKIQAMASEESTEKLLKMLKYRKKDPGWYSEFDMLAVAKELVRRFSPQSAPQE